MKKITDYDFLNFFLKPASPTIPEPRSNIIAGSGTGFTGAEVILAYKVAVFALFSIVLNTDETVSPLF